MALDFSAGSPMAKALQSLVQPKLAECGWTTSDDDTTLFEYILLMLANGKNEHEVATELSNDLLDDPDIHNSQTRQFSRWLFENLDTLRGQVTGVNTHAEVAHSNEHQDANASHDTAAPAQDTDMDGAGDGALDGSAGTTPPTAPRSMRNGSAARPTRGGRSMLNQVNRQMNRNDDSALHRVRGSGRVGSHGREPPRGPRSNNIGRGVEALANGRGLGNVNFTPGPMANMNMGGDMTGSLGGGGGPMGQNAMQPNLLNPQQQVALMALYEQQSQMMTQIFGGVPPPGGSFGNTNFHQGRGGRRPFNPRAQHRKREGQDENMADGAPAENGEETAHANPATTMCMFNKSCSKPECPFVHSSPAAPVNAVVDMNDTCTYGAACMNWKCVGKHPSPAQRAKYQADQECMFFPNCRDKATCPYKHPTVAPCRNGADCTQAGCQFWHSSVPCKFNPCTNVRCHFKHLPNQKQVKSNVWVASKPGEGENQEGDKQDHVSQRKFVDDSNEEELIIPGKTVEMGGTEAT